MAVVIAKTPYCQVNRARPRFRIFPVRTKGFRSIRCLLYGFSLFLQVSNRRVRSGHYGSQNNVQELAKSAYYQLQAQAVKYIGFRHTLICRVILVTYRIAFKLKETSSLLRQL